MTDIPRLALRHAALLLAALALAPGRAAADGWSYAAELSGGYDSNVGNAGDDHDTRDSLVTSAGASATWERRFGLYSALQVRASAATDQLNDVADLSHVRGALRNGLTPNEIRAVLTQIAIYCGIPVGVDCFRIAKAVLSKSERN